MIVMLKKDHPGTFHRSVFRTVGEGTETVTERVKVLEFKPGEPVDVLGEDLEAIRADIGNFLISVEVDEKGRARVSPPSTVTEQSGNRIAELELEIAALEEQVALLIEQVRDLGADPIVEAVDEPSEAKPSRGRRRKAAVGAESAT